MNVDLASAAAIGVAAALNAMFPFRNQHCGPCGGCAPLGCSDSPPNDRAKPRSSFVMTNRHPGLPLLNCHSDAGMPDGVFSFCTTEIIQARIRDIDMGSFNMFR